LKPDGTPDQHQRLHAVVRGRVQGVSFRYYTEMTAIELGLTGWVRNLPDRSVEVVAEGAQRQLEHLLVFLNRGPSAARVTQVESSWSHATGEFDGFQIRWFR
jgi:acylphosphatase